MTNTLDRSKLTPSAQTVLSMLERAAAHGETLHISKVTAGFGAGEGKMLMNEVVDFGAARHIGRGHYELLDIHDANTQVYPDTRDGVLQMLKDNADLEVVAFLKDARVWRDPSVQGVWLIELDDKKRRVVAYLAGYRDAMARRRNENDFEVVD